MADDDARVPVKKSGVFTISGGRPIRFSEQTEYEGEWEPSPLARAIGITLRAHWRAARDLLAGKFANSLALAPPHLRQPCDILVVCCTDGVIVRYDVSSETEPKVRYADLNERLRGAAPNFSEQVVHFPDDPATYTPSVQGPGLEVIYTDPGGAASPIARIHPVIYASAKIPSDLVIPPPGQRPPSIVSLHKELQLEIHGAIFPQGAPVGSLQAPKEHFIGHGIVPLGVGWEAIEIYPRVPEDHWKPEYAQLWAELDLLSAIMQTNAMTAALSQLDGRVAARLAFADTLDAFERVLDQKNRRINF
jgi:hypothetical protein